MRSLETLKIVFSEITDFWKLLIRHCREMERISKCIERWGIQQTKGEKMYNMEKHAENGWNVECTHQGQRRRYGDVYYEYVILSDKPASEVEEYCKQHVYKCNLTTEQYLKDARGGCDFGDLFRLNYEFKERAPGKYFYRVTRPSTH